MDKNKLVLLWIAAGAGVILLYAAIKDKSPSGILTAYVGGEKPGPLGTNLGDPVSNPDPTGNDRGGIGVQAPQFTTDANGFTVPVPPAYSHNPDLFVPPVGP